MVIGATTGEVELKAEGIRMDDRIVSVVGKGAKCSIAFPGERLHKGDKVFLWKKKD